MTFKKVLLIDLWDGPGHWYYTGALYSELAKLIPLGQLHGIFNTSTDKQYYQGGMQHFIDAPTRLNRAQAGRIFLQPVIFGKFLYLLNEIRPDVVHIVFPHPWTSTAMCYLARVSKLVATLHDITPHPGENTWRNRYAINQIIKFARTVIVHGPSSKAEAIEIYPRFRDLFLDIPFGIPAMDKKLADLTQYQPRELRYSPSNTIDLLLSGRMLPYKGIDIALAAIIELHKTNPQIRLILAGEGDLTPYRELLRDAGSAALVINRRISTEELSYLLKSVRASLLPYRHASGSGVIAQAIAHNCPVIASDLGALRDMVGGYHPAMLIKPNDAVDLARCIVQLIQRFPRNESLGPDIFAGRSGPKGFKAIAEQHTLNYSV